MLSLKRAHAHTNTHRTTVIYGENDVDGSVEPIFSNKGLNMNTTYSMKFGSSERMLLRSGKAVRPVLKIPLNIRKHTHTHTHTHFTV